MKIYSHATDKDTAWRRQMGTDSIARWDGAKTAIRAVLSDTSLTSGAHFGFGHWNAGQGGPLNDDGSFADSKHMTAFRRTIWCHHSIPNKGKPNCQYYGTWQVPAGTDPKLLPKRIQRDTSSLCHTDACLMVGISAEGYKEIADVIESVDLAWGTDATCICSDGAYGYFIQDERYY